jgi:hypothetical protein
MTRSLRAQPVEGHVRFLGEAAGRSEEPNEHHRGETDEDQQPAIE